MDTTIVPINGNKTEEKGTVAKNTELIVPKILIVDDDISLEPIWLYIIEKVHSKAQIVWATSETEAENLILDAQKNGRAFDLIITDIFLCGSKTGLDLWARFFNDMHGCIIVTSGVEYSRFVKYFEGSQRQPIYLQKPLLLNECIEVISAKIKEFYIPNQRY